jgi:hypothetical protein
LVFEYYKLLLSFVVRVIVVVPALEKGVITSVERDTIEESWQGKI